MPTGTTHPTAPPLTADALKELDNGGPHPSFSFGVNFPIGQIKNDSFPYSSCTVGASA